MNLKPFLLLLLLWGATLSQASADISSRPNPTPLPGAKLTFKQKWKRFFKNVSDDFHMESAHTRQADKFHENLRKPKEQLPVKKLTRKERKLLEKNRKQALSTRYTAPSYSNDTSRAAADTSVPYAPYAPAPSAPVAPEPLGYDPVAR